MSLGLYNGELAVCLGKIFNEAGCSSTSIPASGVDDRIGEIVASLEETEEMSFPDGIIGIAWAIEWLSQKKALAADTNLMLEEVDDLVYNQVNTLKSDVLSFNNGILSRLYYLFQRLDNKDSKSHYFRFLLLKDCIRLIIEDIAEKICVPDTAFLKQHVFLGDRGEPYVLSRLISISDKLMSVKAFSHPMEKAVFHLLKLVYQLNTRYIYRELSLNDLTSYVGMMHGLFDFCSNHHLEEYAGELLPHIRNMHRMIQDKEGEFSFFDALVLFMKTTDFRDELIKEYESFYAGKVRECGCIDGQGFKIGSILFEAVIGQGPEIICLARDILVI